MRLPIPPLSRSRGVQALRRRITEHAASAERVSIAARGLRVTQCRDGASAQRVRLIVELDRLLACPSAITKTFPSPRGSCRRAAARGRRDLPLRARRRRLRRRRRRARRASGSRRSPRSTTRSTRSRAARRPPSRRFPRSRAAIREHALPLAPFHDLLSAFRQDVTTTRYATYADVLDYCRALRQPGRPPAARAVPRARRRTTSRRSDAICTGLQLTNFWQDVADRLAQGPRLPPAGRPRPLRRDATRRSPTDASTTRGARCMRVRDGARARAAASPGGRWRARCRGALGLELSAVIAGGTAHPRRASTPWAATCSRTARCCARATGRVGARSCRAVRCCMTPDEYCQQKAAQSGSSFYYSFLFLPPPRRRAITALYAFCREVDDVVDEVHDPDVAQTKLAWWRQRDRRTSSPARRSIRSRRRSCRSCASSRCREEHFQTIIDGMAMDLEHTRYLDFAALELYCHRVAGVVGLLSAEIFGYTRPGDARLRARPRHRVPAHQHLPRRRRGRAPRPHLPAAGRPRALRRRAVVARCAREYSRRVPRADGVPGRARARLVRPRAARSCPPPTARRSARASSWRRSTARCSTRSRATATACSTGARRSRRCASCGSRGRRGRRSRRGHRRRLGRAAPRPSTLADARRRRARCSRPAPVLGGRARRVERDGLRARQRPAPAARRLRARRSRCSTLVARRRARRPCGGRLRSCRSSPRPARCADAAGAARAGPLGLLDRPARRARPHVARAHRQHRVVSRARARRASRGRAARRWRRCSRRCRRAWRELLWEPLCLAALNTPARARVGAGLRQRAARRVRAARRRQRLRAADDGSLRVLSRRGGALRARARRRRSRIGTRAQVVRRRTRRRHGRRGGHAAHDARAAIVAVGPHQLAQAFAPEALARTRRLAAAHRRARSARLRADRHGLARLPVARRLPGPDRAPRRRAGPVGGRPARRPARARPRSAGSRSCSRSSSARTART